MCKPTQQSATHPTGCEVCGKPQAKCPDTMLQYLTVIEMYVCNPCAAMCRLVEFTFAGMPKIPVQHGRPGEERIHA